MNAPTSFDVIIVGSGFGGALAAHRLVGGGARVLMIERGDWVPRGNAALTGRVGPLGPYSSRETPYAVQGAATGSTGSFACVGGASVFYGGVSLRFRKRDFDADPDVVGDSGARWPYGYETLEPWYAEAERVLGVAGEPGSDPTEPPRSAPWPQRTGALSPASRLMWDAARSLGLRPFRLPLAFNHGADRSRPACAACSRCDGFACASGAKNDVATAVLPPLLRRGLQLRVNSVVTRLVAQGGRVRAVECVDRHRGTAMRFTAEYFVLAAGALASPHLVLASGLDRLNPGKASIGRYLMRHVNAVVAGVFPSPPDRDRVFHKQVGIHDDYWVDGRKVGGLQQLVTPPREMVQQAVPWPLGPAAAATLPLVTGLLAIAEDQPRPENRLEIDPSRADRFSLPRLVITHRYTPRDLQSLRALVSQARRVLKRAGAAFTYVQPVQTFSHACGTLRVGQDPATSVVDPEGRFRGLENLFVSDASTFATSAAVNPSLTIAATALRTGAGLAERLAAQRKVLVGQAS